MSWRWGSRAGLAVADQGVVAISSLGLQIVLARLLQPEDYGAFAISYTVLLVVLGVQTALVTEPLTVLAPTQEERMDGAFEGEFEGEMVSWNRWLSAALALLVMGGGVVLAVADLGLAFDFLLMAAALPGFLLLHFRRRQAYLHFEPALALRVSVRFAGLLVIGIAALLATGHLTKLTAWLAFGAASFLSAAAGARSTESRARKRGWGRSARKAWFYGRWILLANTAHWAGLGLYVPAIGLLQGLEQAGSFRAFQNLVAPVQQALAAGGLLALPWLSRQVQVTDHLGRKTLRILSLTVPPVILFSLLLASFGGQAVGFLYDQDSYSEATHLLPWWSLSVLLMPFTHALALAARAAMRPRAILASKVAAAIMTVGIGLLLIRHLGLLGAILALILSQAVELSFLVPVVLRRRVP